MVSSHAIKKIIILFTSIFYLGCNTHTKELNTFNEGIKLKSGDIICRLGNGYFSKFFKRYSVKEKKYSHIGIISIQNDSIFVYHSEASELTGVGKVKREVIHSFLNKIKTYGIYRINSNEFIKEKIVNEAELYYKDETKFDLNFDLTNDDEVYCSELVANSINKGFQKKVIRPNIIFNDKEFYGIDDIYLNKELKLVYTN